jgi:membrane fusion protein (multidrug efflux system)
MQSVATKPHTARRPAARGILLLFVVLFAAIAAAVVFAILPRLAHQKTLLADSRADAVHLPQVLTAKAQRAAASDVLELPGNLQPLNEAPIYARTDGYLKQRLVDYGTPVKKGQLIAELETPDLDQQIQQAEAALSQSQAAVKQHEAALVRAEAAVQLARVTLQRYKRLSAHGVFSKQDEDEKQANFEVLQADVGSAEANLAAGKNAVAVNEANLRRLNEVKGFARILAPFDGVVTARNVDVGTLITAGNAGPNREMYRVAQIDPLRIFVSVPQAYVGAVRAAEGQEAELTVQQLPGRKFAARVAQLNSALDANSRTMLTVLTVRNPRGELLPGMFGYVRFRLSDTFRPLIVPGDTIIPRSDGPHVAVVNAQGRVEFRRIEPGRDFGSRMEVLSGVSEGDTLVVNATDEIREGVQVQPRTAK